jgi:hypothetical protein
MTSMRLPRSRSVILASFPALLSSPFGDRTGIETERGNGLPGLPLTYQACSSLWKSARVSAAI